MNPRAQEQGVLPRPEELFLYLPSYRVLICRPCRYAVQPAAVSRHLKEIHHILRKTRQPFAAYVSGLDLAEPADVAYPSEDDFPVDHLPVEKGWRCEAPGCDYLCVSNKRMEMHWSAVHRCKGVAATDWSAVQLQTFFRGNMLRYFSGPRITPSPKTRTFFEKSIDIQGGASPKQALVEKFDLGSDEVAALDQYFSHTHATFLVNEQTPDMRQIWLQIVPTLALDHRFVLDGMLAAGCLHLAYNQPHSRASLITQSIAHQGLALPAFRNAIEHPSRKNCDAVMCFAFILLLVSIGSDRDWQQDQLFIVRECDSERDQPLILPQWLHFLRAGCIMLSDVWTFLEAGPMQGLVVEFENEEIPLELVMPRFTAFLMFIPSDGTWTDDETDTYKRAAYALAEAFTEVEGTGQLHGAAAVRNFNVLSHWVLKVDDAALVLLTGKHPGMLILLAHYCIILKHLDDYWYLNNRAVTLLSSVERMLDPQWHCYLTEPRTLVYGREQSPADVIFGNASGFQSEMRVTS